MNILITNAKSIFGLSLIIPTCVANSLWNSGSLSLEMMWFKKSVFDFVAECEISLVKFSYKCF